MARAGFTISQETLNKDLTKSHVHGDSIKQAWKEIYEALEDNWEFYELGEKLVDFEDYFRRGRFNRVTAVERIIGFKQGAGGTAGVSYLRRMLEVELFLELWSVRADL